MNRCRQWVGEHRDDKIMVAFCGIINVAFSLWHSHYGILMVAFSHCYNSSNITVENMVKTAIEAIPIAGRSDCFSDQFVVPSEQL